MNEKEKAFETFNEMSKLLEKLKSEVTFREYIGFEMCMQVFTEKYNDLIINKSF